MRLPTKIAIGGFVSWMVFNTIANSSVPTGIYDPEFRAKIGIANNWQSLGTFAFIGSILSMAVTIWKKLMNEPKTTVHGDIITNSTRIVTRPSGVGVINVGDGIAGSVVTIGTSPAERNKQSEGIDALIAKIRESALGTDQKEEAIRNLANVKDEVKADNADKDRIARWLNHARDIIKVGAAGAELIEKGEEVYKMFGGRL